LKNKAPYFYEVGLKWVSTVISLQPKSPNA
jgi:hypothetical protein